MEKRQDENSSSLYRRFVKHFRSLGVQSATKRNRFYIRKLSKNVQRQQRLLQLEKQQKYEEAYRLGKVSAAPRHGRRR